MTAARRFIGPGPQATGGDLADLHITRADVAAALAATQARRKPRGDDV
jgi:hypothetical protein